MPTTYQCSVKTVGNDVHRCVRISLHFLSKYFFIISFIIVLDRYRILSNIFCFVCVPPGSISHFLLLVSGCYILFTVCPREPQRSLVCQMFFSSLIMLDQRRDGQLLFENSGSVVFKRAVALHFLKICASTQSWWYDATILFSSEFVYLVTGHALSDFNWWEYDKIFNMLDLDDITGLVSLPVSQIKGQYISVIQLRWLWGDFHWSVFPSIIGFLQSSDVLMLLSFFSVVTLYITWM